MSWKIKLQTQEQGVPKFHVAIQLAGGFTGKAEEGYAEDGDYIIIHTYNTKAERDLKFKEI